MAYPLTSCNGKLVLQSVVCHSRRYFGENLQKITLDQVCLGHAACHIATVQLPIRKFEPFSQVLQAKKSVVSERVCSVIANTTKLCPSQYKAQMQSICNYLQQ